MEVDLVGDDKPPRAPAGDPWNPRADAARVAGQGLTLAFATGLFLWVGWLLDNRLGTVPVFTVLGAFVGAAAGLYSLYYHVVLEPRRQREREEHER